MFKSNQLSRMCLIIATISIIDDKPELGGYRLLALEKLPKRHSGLLPTWKSRTVNESDPRGVRVTSSSDLIDIVPILTNTKIQNRFRERPMPRHIGAFLGSDGLGSLVSSNRVLAMPCIKLTSYRNTFAAVRPDAWFKITSWTQGSPTASTI